LLGQQNEAIPQAQNRKGRTVPQAKILPELFGNRKLAFFADLGRSQVFERGIMSCHR
jgi:hypothetical protein